MLKHGEKDKGGMSRLCDGLKTLKLFLTSGVTPGGGVLGNGGQLLVSLLQLVASQPTSKAALDALHLVRMALLADPSLTEEILARGGVDRLGSALAKAKRHQADPDLGARTLNDVLSTLRLLCTYSAAITYFNSGKSPAVYVTLMLCVKCSVLIE